MPAQYGLGDNRPAKTFRWLYLPFMFLLALACMVLSPAAFIRKEMMEKRLPSAA
jgi:hypothetical protein